MFNDCPDCARRKEDVMSLCGCAVYPVVYLCGCNRGALLWLSPNSIYQLSVERQSWHIEKHREEDKAKEVEGCEDKGRFSRITKSSFHRASPPQLLLVHGNLFTCLAKALKMISGRY